MVSRSSAGNSLEPARRGGISNRGPSSIDYKDVPVAGFEILPASIRSYLSTKGLIGVRPLCASCEDLEIRRRVDGSHYQSGTAWWGDESRAVLITCRREVEHRSGKKFSPSGAWNVTCDIHHLGDVGGPEVTKWKFHDNSSGRGAPSPPVTTHDPLDLLPPEVAAPVRGGLSDVWMRTTPSSVTEYLTAIRITAGKALLLEANRRARTEFNLHRSKWKLTTLAAPISQSEALDFSCGHR